MPQHPANGQEACSPTALTVQALRQHDLHYPVLQCDAADKDTNQKGPESRLESGLNSLQVDFTSNIKDKVIENDVGRPYTQSVIPPRASLAPATGYYPPDFVLVNKPTLTHVNGHCYSHSTSSLVAEVGTVDGEASSDAQVAQVGTEDHSLNQEEQYSFQYSAGPKLTDWEYDLAGISAQRIPTGAMTWQE
jgi:hypothetical protein